MTFELQRESAPNFMDFCRRNRDDVLNYAAGTAAAIPSDMYCNDNKFDVGKFTAYTFELGFKSVQVEGKSPIGYDLFYKNGEINESFSLKFNKTNPFQVKSVRKNLTQPRPIILKNVRKVNFTKNFLSEEELNFDYLFTVGYDVVELKNYDQHQLFFNDRSKNEVLVKVAYGVATKQTVLDHIVEESLRNHQLQAILYNDDWDYFSGYENRLVEIDRTSLNELYKRFQMYMWDVLYSRVKSIKKEN